MKAPSPDIFRVGAMAACLAGIVHICATFAMPALSERSAYHRLTRLLPLNALTVLPPITPTDQPLPFLSADARYAMCRYDTGVAPVAVDIRLPDSGWLLAMYSPQGDNFYYVPGQPGRPAQLSLLLVPPGNQAAAPAANADTATPAGAPVVVPTRRGILVIKAPVRGIAYDAVIASELQGMRCRPLQRI